MWSLVPVCACLALICCACTTGQRVTRSLSSIAGVEWSLSAGSGPLPLVPAVVPGDVNVDLEREGLLPPLFYGTNSMEASWVPARNWTYSAVFEWTGTDADASASVFLRFAGCDYTCHVWLNGHQLGEHTGSFEPFQYDVSPVMRRGSNTLLVLVAAAPAVFLEEGVLFTHDAQAGAARTTYNIGTKMRETLTRWKAGIGNGGGVDFATPAWPCGIWNEVALVSTVSSSGRLLQDSLVVLPRLAPPYSKALLDVRVDMESLQPDAGAEVQVHWSVQCDTNSSAPSASLTSPPVFLNGSVVHVTAQLAIAEPSLWWPHGYGQQNMYTLNASLVDASAQVVDLVHVRFGIRDLQFADNTVSTPTRKWWTYNDYGVYPPCNHDLDTWCKGQYEYLGVRNSTVGGLPVEPTRWTHVINGRKVFAKGANWVPIDVFPGRSNTSSLRAVVAAAVHANLNFLRVWGGGIIEKQGFFEACDELGVLLLYEMAHMAPRPDPTRPGVLEGEAVDTRAAVMQLINHPSVVQYGYGNELYVNASWSTPAAQYVRICQELDGTRPVRMANPIPEAQRHGPYFFYFHRNEKGERLVSYDVFNKGCSLGTAPPPVGCRPGTAADLSTGPALPQEWDEVGACALSSVQTLRRAIPPESLWPINGSDGNWQWHNGFGRDGNDTWVSPNSYRWLFTRARGPNGTWPAPLPSLELEVAASQWAQAEAYRYIFSSMRWRKWHLSAVAIWTFNEPWPNAAHGCVVDWFGHPKMAFYALRRANALLTLSLQYSDVWTAAGQPWQTTLWMDSELCEEVTVNVTVSISLLDGHMCMTRALQVKAGPSAARLLTTLQYTPPASLAGRVMLVRLSWEVVAPRATHGSGGAGMGAAGCALPPAAVPEVYVFGLGPPHSTSDTVSAPLAELFHAPPAVLALSRTDTGALKLANTAAAVAAVVRLRVVGSDGAEEAGHFFSDNFFMLLPGEVRVCSMTVSGAQRNTTVCADAWNAKEVCMR